MRLELAKSRKEIERLECEKMEQNEMIECLQTRCHSLQRTLEFMTSPTNHQSRIDTCSDTNRRKHSPDGKPKTKSSRNEDDDDDNFSDYFHGYSSGDDEIYSSGKNSQDIMVPEVLRWGTSSTSLDLSLSFSKMFGSNAVVSPVSDRLTGSTELTSSNERLESKVEELQREKAEQKEEYLQKLKMRDESILNLEDTLVVKEQTITVLRNVLEERLQVSTYVERSRGRIQDTALHAKSDIILEKNKAAKAAAKISKHAKAKPSKVHLSKPASPRRVRFAFGC